MKKVTSYEESHNLTPLSTNNFTNTPLLLVTVQRPLFKLI